MNVVGYLRVSTGRQARKGVSLAVQEKAIRSWAAANAAASVRIFSDNGKSGRGVNNRPGFKAALDAAKKGDCFVVHSLSRFARSTVHASQVLEQLKKRGVALFSLSEKLDLRGAWGGFIFSVFAAIAQLESELIAERVASAWAFKRSRGEKTGGDLPFGYGRRGRKLIPKESEQTAVHFMVRSRGRGSSFRTIARALEAKGVRRKQGGRVWYPAAVRQVVLTAALRKPCKQALRII